MRKKVIIINQSTDRKSINIPIKKDRIVFIGRTDQTKGLLILVKALSKMNKIGMDCYIQETDLIYFNKVKKFANTAMLDIKFYPPIASEEISKTLSTYKLLVLPSFSEMAPLLSLEALNCKVPVLASNHPSFIDQANKNKGIFLFENGNWKSLKKNLNNVLNHLNISIVLESSYSIHLQKHIQEYSKYNSNV